MESHASEFTIVPAGQESRQFHPSFFLDESQARHWSGLGPTHALQFEWQGRH